MNNTNQAAQKSADTLKDQGHQVLDSAKSYMDENVGRAKEMLDRGVEKSLDTFKGTQECLGRSARKTVEYARENPTNTLLIAAGVGALVVLLASLCASQKNYRYFDDYKPWR